MLPRCLLTLALLVACSPAALPNTTAPLHEPEARPFLAPWPAELDAPAHHVTARLAPPFAHGDGTRRALGGEARTALVTTP